MEISEPIIFEPLFMERVWGARRLESLYGKHLPPGARIGESWEIVDRPEAQSVVHRGPLKGRTLHELWTELRDPVFGGVAPGVLRFPLLFKFLDAQERLSVQVHPPASIAPRLHGEPKTEMWYFADAGSGSEIYAGLKHGVTAASFEQALNEGRVADLIHTIRVNSGDAIFIPSGRIHAIGAGNVIVEVQQNSDTTYRVFDWNRCGLDGRPRELHIAESLESIDFTDVEPCLASREGETLASCDFFHVEKWNLEAPRGACTAGTFAIFTCVEGKVGCGGLIFNRGDFFLVPAAASDLKIEPLEPRCAVLRTTIPPIK